MATEKPQPKDEQHQEGQEELVEGEEGKEEQKQFRSKLTEAQVRKWIAENQKKFEKQRMEAERKVTFPPEHKGNAEKFLALIQEKVKQNLVDWHPGCSKGEDGSFVTGPIGRLGPGDLSPLSKVLTIPDSLVLYVKRSDKQQREETEADLDEILQQIPASGTTIEVTKDYFSSWALPEVAGKCYRLSIKGETGSPALQILKSSGILRETFPKWYRDGFFEEDAPWETEMKMKNGLEPNSVYRHYKGGMCRILNLAKMLSNLQPVVVYQALSTKGGKQEQKKMQVWVRPLTEFTEQVTVNGVKVSRFTRV